VIRLTIDELFRIHLEVNGGGGNLHALGAMVSPGLYYERGLLHPFVDYDTPPPWLNRPVVGAISAWRRRP
jgi:hypothetical protein